MSTSDEDEQSLISAVRADMVRLLYLANLHHTNYLAQWKACIPDANTHYREANFTMLEEQNEMLREDYEPIRCNIIRYMKRYDNYCGDRKIAYSSTWNQLLNDLRPYLSGIGSLGSASVS